MREKDKEKSRVRVQVVEEGSDVSLKETGFAHHENHEDKQEEHEEKDNHGEHEHREEQEEKDEYEEHGYHSEHEHEKNEEVQQTPKHIPQQGAIPSKDKIPFWILFFAFLIGLTLGAGLIGGIFYYRSKVGGLPSITTKKDQTAVNEAAEPTPTATPEEKLDLTKYSVNILNGSGIAGEAGRVDTLLKSAGFTNTKVGNAGSYDFTDTEVAIKKDFPAALFDEIKKDLSNYQIKQVDDLKSSSDYDIVITVGKTKI